MTVAVDAVVYFNVIDAEQALCSVDDFRYHILYQLHKREKCKFRHCCLSLTYMDVFYTSTTLPHLRTNRFVLKVHVSLMILT